VLADVRCRKPRRDVPVDVAHVIVILVFAQIREVEPEAAKERPVVAVQEPVEAAQYRPFEPAQRALGVARRVDRHDLVHGPPTLAAVAAALPPAGARFAPWGGPAALTFQDCAANLTCDSSGFSGGAMRCMIRCTRSSGVRPSASASYDSTSRWRSTSGARSLTSSGNT